MVPLLLVLIAPPVDALVLRFTGTLSLNAGVLASVLLASRLATVAEVFAIEVFAIEMFALVPMARRCVQVRSLPAMVVSCDTSLTCATAGILQAHPCSSHSLGGACHGVHVSAGEHAARVLLAHGAGGLARLSSRVCKLPKVQKVSQGGRGGALPAATGTKVACRVTSCVVCLAASVVSRVTSEIQGPWDIAKVDAGN